MQDPSEQELAHKPEQELAHADISGWAGLSKLRRFFDETLIDGEKRRARGAGGSDVTVVALQRHVRIV